MKKLNNRKWNFKLFMSEVNNEDTKTDQDATGDGTDKEVDLKEFAKNTQGRISEIAKKLSALDKTTKKIDDLSKTMSEITTVLKGLQKQDKVNEDQDDDSDKEADEKMSKDATQQNKEANKSGNTVDEESKKKITTLERNFKRVEEELKLEREARITAENRNRESLRDTKLLNAVSDPAIGNAINPQDAVMFLQHRAEYDQDQQEWVISVGNGETVSIEEGVKKFLPKYMQKPKTGRGGAGGTGNQDAGDQTTTLATMETNTVNLGLQAKKDSRLMGRYLAAKREFEKAGGNVEKVTDAVANG